MSSTERTAEGIAIVGLAGRFPGSRDAAEFWRNLCEGRDLLARFTPEQLAATGYDAAALGGLPEYVPVRGVVERPEWFDRAFFGVPPKEAEVLDPQQRVFLEIAWEALEDAGCDPARFAGLIGVFAGMSNNTYFAHFVRHRQDLLDAVGIVNATIANEKDFLTTRLAYKLNLRGPALNIQTACSSSLVAVAVACEQLRMHQCDAALAGGVSLTFPQDRGYVFQEGGMTSPDGWCRPFDERANGTVFSSGAGVVVLKRLEDALANGDQIYAVITGEALNNDGQQKVSFAAPSIDGQAEVIALAQAVANVTPDTISYIEAHGTATPLGDPIEVAGLTQVFRPHTGEAKTCALASVKGNIGHCDAASGVASLIKVALAFRHEAIPPTIKCETPNPALHLDETPFYLNTELKPWRRSETLRRAGVSSLGVGGTNAHLVLEEAPVRASQAAEKPAHLLVLSGKTAAALDQRAKDLAAHLEAHPELSLTDVAFTLGAGRQRFAHRAAVTARDRETAIAALRQPLRARREDARQEAQVAFVLPGQGSQYRGMGAELYRDEPAFRAAFDECVEALRPHLDADHVHAHPDTLNDARVAQPAVFAFNYALARYWISLGLQPAALLGHSVGEFAAAAIAGVFSLADAAKLVATRAKLVQELPRGGMLAVRLGPEDAQALAAELGISVAAINSHRLCVLSGELDAIAAAEARCAERDVPARRLGSSHAFHSAMVEPVSAELLEAVRSVARKAPEIPIVSSVTGQWLTEAQATDPQYWATHLRATVRFADALGTLFAAGDYAVLETGAGQGLTQLARQHPAHKPAHELAFSVAEDSPELETVAAALGRLWLAGVEVDWARLLPGAQRVSLPTYPFERQRYFADLPAGVPMPIVTAATDGDLPPHFAPRAKALVDVAASPSATLNDATSPANDAQLSTLNSQPSSAERLAELLTDLSGIDLSSAAPETTLLDLGFDSLFLSQAAVTISRKFGVKVAFRQLLRELSTLGALAAHLQEHAVAEPKEEGRRQKPEASIQKPVETAAVPNLVASATTAAHGPFRPVARELSSELTPRQQRWLRDFVSRYNARTRGSKRHTEQHRAHLADPRAVSGFKQIWKEMVYPIVVDRSEGARLFDIDGNEWNDLHLSFGAAMFGHQPKFLVDAVEEQLRRGMEIGPTSPLAGEVAALLCELTGLERATFCNTGSEAVMGALRIARTVTGRQRIVYFSESYHGIADEVLGRRAGERAMPIAPGLPPEALANALILDYGRPETLAEIRRDASDIAAVLVEPVQSRRPELQPAEFLRDLRALTSQHGIALIFDELITGFRSHPGGAQAHFGVQADIATYGKVLGGGIPIGAIAGRAEYMDAFDGGPWRFGDDSFPGASMTFFAGTFVRHPLALAAARAVLTHLRDAGPGLQQGLAIRTAGMLAGVAGKFAGTPFTVAGFSSNWLIHTARDFAFGGLLYALMRHRGFHIWENRPCFLSTVHSDANALEIVEAFGSSVDEMEDAEFFARPGRKPRQKSAPETLPTTEGQRELWCLCQVDKMANTAANETWTLMLDGALDVDCFRTALRAVVTRHESLRGSFDASGEKLRIAPGFELEIPLSEDNLTEVQRAESTRVFDLQKAPLLTLHLVRLGPERHALVFNAHHLVCDGWSCDVFLREAAALYSVPAAPLPPADSAAEYQQWESALHETPEFQADAAYWLDVFKTVPPPLELPGNRPRPAHRSYRGASEVILFPAEFPAKLQQFGAKQGATLFSVLLAGFQALLVRLTGARDVVVGVPSAGQSLAGMDHLIGHCVNMLPVRLAGAPDESFNDVLDRAQAAILDAFEHRRVTFGWLLRQLTLPRDPARTPLVSVTFNLDPPLSDLSFGGLRHKLQANPRSAFQFDLGVNCDTTADGFRVICHYSTDLFDPQTIRDWMQQFRALLEAAAADPAQPLSALPFAAPAPASTAIAGPQRSIPLHQGVHEIFAERAAQTPDAVALVDGPMRLSYRELNTRADALAAALPPAKAIGILLDRSADFIIAALAILKSGAAYVPLDRAQPEHRLASIAEDAAITAIISREPHARRTLPAQIEVLDLAAALPQNAGAPPATRHSTPATRPPAYVMFTSGSTGRPKGAEIPHSGITRLVVNSDYVEFQPSDVVAHASNVAFDAATFEIWGALLNGARLVVVPPKAALEPRAFLANLRAQGVTILFLTTPLFHQFARDVPDAFGFLRYLVVGGDALEPAAARAVLQSSAPPRHLINGYGPTETTTFAICHDVRQVAEGAGSVPIGQPIANTHVYLLDENRRSVPAGERGEIYIGGPGVARGYANRPELTAECFLADPEHPGRLMYKTGDLGRLLPDGAIEFLGRLDDQVKIRGFRVEPAEVEAALRRHPEVGVCKVRAQANGASGRTLIGYVSPRNGHMPEPDDLRAFLAARLPEYLVPSAFVVLERLPLNPNGKLDLAALPAPKTNSRPQCVAPRNRLEQDIAALWQGVLNAPTVSVTDDFFLTGGHSLLAIQLIGRLRERFGVELPVRQLFETPTIQGLATHIAAQLPQDEPADDYDLLVPIQRGERSRRPLFVVPGGWGGETEFLVYAALARQIDPQLPLYGLRARRDTHGGMCDESVEQMAASAIGEMRRFQPQGPYLLAGECVGGIIAYEMARQLRAAGEELALVLLLDSDRPSAAIRRWFARSERSEHWRLAWEWKVRQPWQRHCEALGKLSFAGKCGYIWQRLARKRAWPGSQPSEPARADDRTVLAQYPRKLMAHTPTPYEGAVTLLVDETAARRDPTLGWTGTHPGPLEIHVVPGDHKSYIREHAATAAAKLREVIARAERSSLQTA